MFLILLNKKKFHFPICSSISKKCYDLVHTDLWGPSVVPSIHGHKYFLTSADDDS